MTLITNYKVTQPLVRSKFFFCLFGKVKKVKITWHLVRVSLFLLLYWGFEKILIFFELRFLNVSALGYISCLIIRSYSSYYVNKLSNISKDYPGLETFLKDGGLTVEVQNSHSVRTATDQRGEQTINKDARTAG